MRLATPLVIVVLAAALLAGCGGSSSSQTDTGSSGSAESSPMPLGSSGTPPGAAAKACDTYAVDAEDLRATGVSCDQARRVMYGWQRDRGCSAPAGASRTSCTSRSYRCLGARTDRGIAVSCSRAGESIAFVAKQRG
jgi:hypothetical protein